MYKYIKEGIATVEMDMRFPAEVLRSDGRTKVCFLQTVMRKENRDDTAVVQFKEGGCVIQKGVPLKQFVELNPEYKHLLRSETEPVLEVEFAPEQLNELQQCTDCPECIGEL